MKAADAKRPDKKMIVVYSPGGGNGKSEIAANLAYTLARDGHRTWVIDANTFAPTQDLIFRVPINGKTFSEFLINSGADDIPWYELSQFALPYRGIPLYLTPSNRAIQEVRVRLQGAQGDGDTLAERLPGAISRKMQEEKIEYLIVDTHPGFEQINDVWLAMTEFLLLVSRINDIDLSNLKAIMKQGDVTDIAYKLIVFNNIILDEHRNAKRDLEYSEVIHRMKEIRSEDVFRTCIEKCEKLSGKDCGIVDVYDDPILYSEKLASWGQFANRSGLFVVAEKEDPFSKRIGELSRYIVGL